MRYAMTEEEESPHGEQTAGNVGIFCNVPFMVFEIRYYIRSESQTELRINFKDCHAIV